MLLNSTINRNIKAIKIKNPENTIISKNLHRTPSLTIMRFVDLLYCPSNMNLNSVSLCVRGLNAKNNERVRACGQISGSIFFICLRSLKANSKNIGIKTNNNSIEIVRIIFAVLFKSNICV